MLLNDYCIGYILLSVYKKKDDHFFKLIYEGGARFLKTFKESIKPKRMGTPILYIHTHKRSIIIGGVYSTHAQTV